MSDALKIAIIAAVPPTLVALLSWLSSRRNAKAILEVHLSLNSRLDQLVESSKKTSHAEGMADQRKLDEEPK